METCEKQLVYVIDKIRRIRNQKSISQLALSQKAHLSQSFLASMESGKKQPSVMTLIKIANALEVSPRVFFPEADCTDKRQIKDEIISLVELL
jgi:transcriptional regulator with XRE-family HTH domain